MAIKVANSTLNASTIDILNVIRENASYDYQSNVPLVEKTSDIPKVGAVIYGTPAFSNQFINALVNRIALVAVKSATFNNPYAPLKKGYLEYGETVEDIFVNIAKVVEYSAEKGRAREFQRTYPDVRSAFHTMNWRVMYPVTVQDEDLRLAFLSVDGVQNLINKIVESVYTAAQYDEFLLFKYMLIKAVTRGKMKPMAIGNGSDLKEAGAMYRGMYNRLRFMSSDFNEAGVKTTTPPERVHIFMDAMYNAQYDINLLASAFNMDKATFEGKLQLIDDFTSFDNERFEVIRANSDGIEEVTAQELALMQNVKAIMVDEEWFQVYDNNEKMTEQYSGSGLYWNYWLHTWKTISNSPFSNAIVFVTSSANTDLPASINVKVSDKEDSDDATVITFMVDESTPSLQPKSVNFVQTEALSGDGTAMHKFGAMLVPTANISKSYKLELMIGGQVYRQSTTMTASAIKTGDTLTFSKVV